MDKPELNLNQIKEIAGDFFAKVGMTNFEMKFGEEADRPFIIHVLTDNASLFIGEKGHNLQSLETILRLIMRKRLSIMPAFYLDINNYRSLREESVKEMAKKAARRARFYKKDVILEPLPAYDRRIIHTELALYPDIKTESIGQEPERRIVIKYLP